LLKTVFSRPLPPGTRTFVSEKTSQFLPNLPFEVLFQSFPRFFTQVVLPDELPPPDRDLTLRQFQQLFGPPPVAAPATGAAQAVVVDAGVGFTGHDIPYFFRATQVTTLPQGLTKDDHQKLTAPPSEAEMPLIDASTGYFNKITAYVEANGFDL